MNLENNTKNKIKIKKSHIKYMKLKLKKYYK